MKALITILAVMAILSNCVFAKGELSAQSEIKNTFIQKFPKAEKVKWEKENAKEWEAEFTIKGVVYSVIFDSKGNWKEIEHEISYKDVASAVKKTMKNEFAGYEIVVTEVIKTATDKSYEFLLCNGFERLEVAVDKTGKVLSKTTEKEAKVNCHDKKECHEQPECCRATVKCK